MKKSRFLVVSVMLIAGSVMAELPTTTKAPERKRYDLSSLAVDIDSLSGGCVVELHELHVLEMYKNSSGGFIANVFANNEYAFEIEIPEEGLSRVYNQKVRLDFELSLGKRPEERHKIYLFITQEPYVRRWQAASQFKEQPFRIIAVGDDLIENEDGTVQYVWSEAKSLDYTKQTKWNIEELSFFGNQLGETDRVIEVFFEKIQNRVENEESGEITGWLVGNLRGEKFQVSFPQEAARFIKKTDHEGGLYRRTYSTLYARAARAADGSLKLIPLGCRQRGRGEYGW